MTSRDPQRRSARPDARSKSSLEWQTAVWEGQPMPADRSRWVERVYLWIDLNRRLFRSICSRAGVDTDDAIQDVAVKLLESDVKLPWSECGKDLEAWIKRTVSNRATDEHRRAVRRQALSTSDEDAPEIIAEELGPQDGLARSELVDAIRDAIDALPEAQRQTARDMLERYERCDTSRSRPRHAPSKTSAERMRWKRTRHKLEQLLSERGVLRDMKVA